MEMGLSGGLYKACVWIMRLAYINLLWILFSLLGLVVVGLFPATVAMFSIERKWIRGQEEIRIFSVFWNEFKKEFIKSNVIGLLLTAFGFLLFVNYRLLTSVESIVTDVFTVLLLVIAFLYFIVLIYIFPVYSHYKVKMLDCIKHAFIVGIYSPLMTIMIGLSILFFYYVGTAIPGIIPLFTGSCLSFATMWFGHCAFKRIEEKHLKSA